MRRVLSLFLVAGMLLAIAPSTFAASKPKKSTEPTVGLEIAKTITMIIGVAISPLLGVGAYGAWTYFDTPKEKKPELPWYARPLFWLPALIVVGLVFVKDVGGAAIPDSLKQPFDVLEAVESKVSGLVAAGAFIPIAANFLPSMSGSEAHQLVAPGLMFATIDMNAILNVLLKPFAVIAFFIIWLAAHAINILILISPFSVVDLALKSFRMFLLSLVVGTNFVSPTVGVVFSLGILLVATFIAGWSFRAGVFGVIFCWDFFTRRRKRFKPDPKTNWMFTAQAFDRAPIRTYGTLTREDDGTLIFQFKPWLVMPARQVKLAPGDYAVGRGLFLRRILRTADNDDSEEVFTLPPRYRGHEEEVTQIYQFGAEREIGLLRAIMSIWRCIKWLIGFGRPTAVPTTA
ncbi:hypothetical protein GC207_05865 [bacterium]|nr:hypothetical protein [bacterium]